MQDEFGELPEQKQEHVNQIRRGDLPAQAGEDVPQAAEAANPIPENERAVGINQGFFASRDNRGTGFMVRGHPRRGVYGRGREGSGRVQDNAGGYGRSEVLRGGDNRVPHNRGGIQQPNQDSGPALRDMLPNKNYVTKRRHMEYGGYGGKQNISTAQPQQRWEVQRPRLGQDNTYRLSGFEYPTAPNGQFAVAMSRITCNPTTANQGMNRDYPYFIREMFNQLQIALTLQMSLNGSQQVKQRALHNVATSQSSRSDMKKILQSRAELWGDGLDPK